MVILTKVKSIPVVSSQRGEMYIASTYISQFPRTCHSAILTLSMRHQTSHTKCIMYIKPSTVDSTLK